MNFEEFKALTNYEKAVILLLEKIEKHLQSLAKLGEE